MEATSPTNTGVNMRRGIVALGAFAAVTALAACSGNTTPAATDNDTTVTLTIWADDTRFTQVQTFASDFTAETGVAWSPRSALTRLLTVPNHPHRVAAD